jgi:ribonuclease HII
MNKRLPTFEYETPLWKQKYLVIGIDEVGRGALAGPVGVGAVCFDPSKFKLLQNLGINDSKKLSAPKREKLSEEIKNSVLAYSVQFSPVTVIDSEGIVSAVNAAIRVAVEEIQINLATKLTFHLLLDAFELPNVIGKSITGQTAIVKGDAKSISIAAASILAKVQRDSDMIQLSESYRPYDWAQNKGYGTLYHLNAIKLHGPTSHHRKLYIRNVLKSSF